LGERLLCKQEVIGSIPFTSTTVAATLRPGDRPSKAGPRATGVMRRWYATFGEDNGHRRDQPGGGVD
jgi:hypothetical protein